MMISKIADRHLSREACIYIRQSTMGQVRFNQESTERQYNLASKAQSLGWSSERIRILDRDLGQSGARTTNREDFKTLVSDVAMSQVGAIFSLEASRSNQDWHRLLELCAITGTLVIDEDGCYDPAEFNDGLVLGMKARLLRQSCTSSARASTEARSTKRTKVSCTSLSRLALFSTTIKPRSTLTKKSRAPFERSSNYSSERAAPTPWCGDSRNSAFAFRVGRMAVPGMANCSGAD
jgi:hypothetical protein